MFDKQQPKLNGKIVRIPLEKLTVDRDYQRGFRDQFVKDAMQDFQPVLIGVPEISKRGSTFFVLDGQHRCELLKAMGYEDVVCHVHEGLTKQEEAYFFRFYNRKRKQITAFEDYRAALVEREPKHKQIEKIVTERDLKVAPWTSTKTISAVWQLRKMIGYGSKSSTGNPERLARVLDLAIGSWEGQENLFEGELLDALFFLIRKYPDLDDKHAVKRWGEKWTPRRLLSAGHDYKYTYNESKKKGIVEQLIVAYDRRISNAKKLRPSEDEAWELAA